MSDVTETRERHATPDTGLTAADVRERVERGLTNEADTRSSRSYSEIVRANVLTRINAILGTMLVVILVFGDIQDALFGVLLVANSLIGITQEIRAKRTLDRLAILNAPKARVVRDGEVSEVAVEEVVLDDLCELKTGDQVPADGQLTRSDGLEIDESLLTGESEPIDKAVSDPVMSGAIVIAGSGRFQATAVGADSYAEKLALEARRFSLTHSELQAGINRLLQLIQYALFPVSALLFWRQLGNNDLDDAMVGTVAGVVGMVPEGLVLLTSLAFGIAAVTLARRNVLVQELPAVEGLARVDVVCLDKTGTLTEGDVGFDRVESLPSSGLGDEATFRAEQVLAAMATDENRNATLDAVAEALESPGWQRTGGVPFSSARKWSAASFDDQGSWFLGAPEMMLPAATADDPTRKQADDLASEGSRVAAARRRRSSRLQGRSRPQDLEPTALVLFQEKIRPDAADTLGYFADQGVDLKVISGDNPRTVAAVARRVGMQGADTAVDARELPEDEAELAEVLEEHSVFGRVTPQQKRAMVHALQSKGHVVAMTGDGVNDALALKDADIGVAMGSGAAATRAVAQLVLLDGKFATMPGIVAEGRRVIANIERSANLFVTKTFYAIFIAVFVVVAGIRYPFLPRHLTIVSTFTIGIPGFVLALAPNTRRYIPGFLMRVLRFCVPAGLIAGTGAISAYMLAFYVEDLSLRQSRTAATLALVIAGLWVLVMLARPFSWWKAALVGAMAGSVAVIMLIPGLNDFYALDIPDTRMLGEIALIGAAEIFLLEVQWRTSRVIERRRAVASASAEIT